MGASDILGAKCSKEGDGICKGPGVEVWLLGERI